MPGAWYNAFCKFNKIFSQRQQVPLCWCNVQGFERLPRLKQSECFSDLPNGFFFGLGRFYLLYHTQSRELCKAIHLKGEKNERKFRSKKINC